MTTPVRLHPACPRAAGVGAGEAAGHRLRRQGIDDPVIRPIARPAISRALA